LSVGANEGDQDAGICRLDWKTTWLRTVASMAWRTAAAIG
jgi:hypothetical protein